MTLDPEQLKEIVTLEDMLDQEEYLEMASETQQAFIARVRHQYQQETWISAELIEIYNLLAQAHQRMTNLRSVPNVFPRSDST